MRKITGAVMLGLWVSGVCWAGLEMKAGEGTFKVGGSLRLRGELIDDLDFSTAKDTTGFMGSRMRMDFGYTLDYFEAFLQPQYTKPFGTPNELGSAASGDLADGLLFLHQGYVKLKWIEEAYLWLGRKELAYGDHLILGNVDWSHVGRAFDGIGGRRNFSDSLWWDVFWTVKFEGAVTRNTTSDQVLVGTYLSKDWSLLVSEAYFLALLNDLSSLSTDENTLALGIRFKSNPDEDLLYRLESTGELITQHGGGATLYAYQADAEVGYQFIQFLGLSLEGAYAHADYRQFYPTGHKWLGHQDLFSRRNIIDLVAHLNSKVMPPLLSLFVDVHYFLRADAGASAYRFSGVPYGTAGSAQDLGVELDAYVQSQVHSHLKMQAGYSQFWTGQYLRDNAGGEDPQFFYVQLLSEF